MVRRSANIWSCSGCYSIFHLNCIKKWAQAPTSVDLLADKNQGSNWRCPGCQFVQLTSSKETLYRCFCGKRKDPPIDPYSTFTFTKSNSPPSFSILSKSPPPMKRCRKSRLKSDQSPTTMADFTFSLTRIAVSQICRSVGYIATDSSALNTLTLTTTKFLQSLAGLASSFSNIANRTEVNLFDIVNGLQDIALSTSDCFPGGSTMHDIESHCLIKSAVLRNLSGFVTYAPEIPFAKPLPRRERDGSSGGDLDHAPVTRSVEMKSVPAWLPPFPDASLYSERCTKDRSDHLWENSDSVIDREILPGSLKSGSCTGSRGGGLPQRRDRVRFKVGQRDWSSGGDIRLERWRDNNDGEYGCDVKVKKKIREEYSAGEWPL